MTVKAFYQQELNNSDVAELCAFASSNKDWIHIKQRHHGMEYQNVRAARIDPDTRIMAFIRGCFLHFNDSYFQYDLFGSCEAQLLKYGPGCHYDWHADYGVSERPDGDRKLSLSIQLSAAWDYNGGEVVIRDWYNREQYVAKDIGSVSVFDSRCPHKVLPIIDGERIAIVAWAHGPQLR